MPDNNRRNWVARAAIMRKGGVHDKTNKAKRHKEKQALKRKLRAERFGSSCIWFRGNLTCDNQHPEKSQTAHYLM